MQTYCLRDDEFRNRHPYRDISKVAFRRGKTSCIAMVHRTRSGSGSHLINDNVCVITSVEDPRLRQYITEKTGKDGERKSVERRHRRPL